MRKEINENPDLVNFASQNLQGLFILENFINLLIKLFLGGRIRFCM